MDDPTDPDSELARRVTSGPPCPLCKFPMEPGFMVIRSGSASTWADWCDPTPEGDRPGPTIESLQWTYVRDRTFQGFRCPECKRLELRYGTSPPTHPP